MSGYQFFRVLQILIGIGLMALVGLAIFAGFICEEIARESAMKREYGETWKAEYEEVHGSLAAARAKIAGCAVGLVGETFALTFLYRSIRQASECESIGSVQTEIPFGFAALANRAHLLLQEKGSCPHLLRDAGHPRRGGARIRAFWHFRRTFK
jgi:hypothetical protein